MGVAEATATKPTWGVRFVREDTGEVLYNYEPNAKQLIAHTCGADEIFYGGAKGGGKTFWGFNHIGEHCLKHGRNANTIVFRRTYDELVRNIIREVIRHFHGRVGTYTSGDHSFHWANGGVTWFRHLERWEDTTKHHGAQYTMIYFDELTDFELRQYLYLWQELRSAYGRGVKAQMLSGGMPGGIGHKWVYDRFIKGWELETIYETVIPDMGVFRRIFVPAKLDDNTALLKSDPGYKARLKIILTPDEYKALVEGDWTLFGGLAFREWDPDIHIVDDFRIPATWKVIRACDWGYSSPFSVGWLAQNPKTKAIYRIAEWYGSHTGPQGGITGIQMTPPELHQGIVDREAANQDAGNFRRPWYGKGDPSMWASKAGEPSIADELNKPEVLFSRANNDRLLRKTLFHSLLRTQPETGKAGFMSFKSCRAFNEIFPQLTKDDKNPEIVQTKGQNHVYDECGYGIVELVQAPAHRETPADLEALAEGRKIPVPI